MIDKIMGTRAYQIMENSTNRTAEKSESNPVSPKRTEDKLEISSAARELSENSQAQNLDKIQSQIEQGFYSRPEVLRSVAQRIQKDLE